MKFHPIVIENQVWPSCLPVIHTNGKRPYNLALRQIISQLAIEPLIEVVYFRPQNNDEVVITVKKINDQIDPELTEAAREIANQLPNELTIIESEQDQEIKRRQGIEF